MFLVRAGSLVISKAVTGRVEQVLARVGPGDFFGEMALFDRSPRSATISWISTAVDEKTRTVQVRADLPNPDGRHLARTFGAGQIVLREEKDVVLVPSEAVHWEGDCNVVFVRDRQLGTTERVSVATKCGTSRKFTR